MPMACWLASGIAGAPVPCRATVCTGTARSLFSPRHHFSLPCSSFCGCFLWLPELGLVDMRQQSLPEVPGQVKPLWLSRAVSNSVSQRSPSGLML